MILIDPSLKLPSIYHSAKINNRENKNPRKTAYSRKLYLRNTIYFFICENKTRINFHQSHQ